MATRIPSKILGASITPGVDEVVPVEVSNALTGKSIGVISEKVSIQPNGLTKLQLFPHIPDQQQGNDEFVVMRIPGGSTEKVGQIFKPAMDNLTNISFACGIRVETIHDDRFDTYIDSTALNAVWTPLNGTLTLETATYVSSSQSAKLTVSTTADAAYQKNITAYDMSSINYVRLCMYSSTTTPTVSIRVSDGINTSQSAEQAITAVNQWTFYEFDVTAFTGNADLSNITQISIYFTGATAGDVFIIDNFRLQRLIYFDDDFESYTDTTTLTAAWVPGGTGIVTLTSGHDSLNGVHLDCNKQGNVTTTITRTSTSPIDLSSYTDIEIDVLVTGQIKGGEYWYIELDDGTNIQQLQYSVSDVGTWFTFSFPLKAFTLIDITNVISITIGVFSGTGKVNYTIDNVLFIQNPGLLTVGLVDFGPTLPTNGAALPAYDPLDTGTTIDIQLLPEKARYLNNNRIKKGLQWDIANNPPLKERMNKLIPGNYYGIVFSVEKVDPSLTVEFFGVTGAIIGGDIYPDGHMFEVAAGSSTITVNNTIDHLFFMTFSDGDITLVGFSGAMDKRPGFDSLLFVGIENPADETYEVLVPAAYPLTESLYGNRLDLGQFAVYKPIGWPIEIYYKDDPADKIGTAIFKIKYIY